MNHSIYCSGSLSGLGTDSGLHTRRTSIGSFAFTDCSSLKSIEVSEKSTSFASEGGVLFNKDKTTLVCYPSGKTESSYSIPDSVTSIGDCTFSRCSSLVPYIQSGACPPYMPSTGPPNMPSTGLDHSALFPRSTWSRQHTEMCTYYNTVRLTHERERSDFDPIPHYPIHSAIFTRLN